MQDKSVFEIDIQVQCKNKMQLAEVILWLTEYDYNFEYDVHQVDCHTEYSVRVPQMSWGHNLAEFAEVLQRNDMFGPTEGTDNEKS